MPKAGISTKLTRREDDVERNKITSLLLKSLKLRNVLQDSKHITEDSYHLNKIVSSQSLKNNAF